MQNVANGSVISCKTGHNPTPITGIRGMEPEYCQSKPKSAAFSIMTAATKPTATTEDNPPGVIRNIHFGSPLTRDPAQYTTSAYTPSPTAAAEHIATERKDVCDMPAYVNI